MFYSSFNKKKTNCLKYIAKACNTGGKKKNFWYRDREGEKKKKKTILHRYRPPSIPSLDLDIFIDYENYKKIGYSFGSSL